jgi:uncharacterized Fe-S radical SAM superfamily protein PflX
MEYRTLLPVFSAFPSATIFLTTCTMRCGLIATNELYYKTTGYYIKNTRYLLQNIADFFSYLLFLGNGMGKPALSVLIKIVYYHGF